MTEIREGMEATTIATATGKIVHGKTAKDARAAAGTTRDRKVRDSKVVPTGQRELLLRKSTLILTTASFIARIMSSSSK